MTDAPFTETHPERCIRCGNDKDLLVGRLCAHCEDEMDDEREIDDYCIDCGGEGWTVTCIDDLCHGAGYCIHGDGMAMCHCNDGDKFPDNAPANWRVPKPLVYTQKPKQKETP